MSLFACRKCNCIENTATGSYWGAEMPLCSECSTGVWHGRFPKRSAKGMLIDQNGYLYSCDGQLPKHCKILGAI